MTAGFLRAGAEARLHAAPGVYLQLLLQVGPPPLLLNGVVRKRVGGQREGPGREGEIHGQGRDHA